MEPCEYLIKSSGNKQGDCQTRLVENHLMMEPKLVFSFSEKFAFCGDVAKATTEFTIRKAGKGDSWKLVRQVSYDYSELNSDRKFRICKGTFQECQQRLDKIVKKHLSKKLAK